MKSDLDVAICTFNNADLLRHTLESLARQQVKEDVKWSVLVVDNNSTDDTAQIVREFQMAAGGLIVRTVREQRQGLVYARQRAVRETSATLLAFVDDDCVLSPEWVQGALDFCHSRENVGAVGGKVVIDWAVRPEELFIQYAANYAQQDFGESPRQLTLKTEYLVGAGLIVSRQALEQSGWPDRAWLTDRSGRQLSSGGDVEICLRIRSEGHELWYCPDLELRHIIPESRMSMTYLQRLQRGIGMSWPVLYTMREARTPTLAWRIRVAGLALGGLVKTLAQIAWHDLLRLRPASQLRQLKLQQSLGIVSSALTFLVQGQRQMAQ